MTDQAKSSISSSDDGGLVVSRYGRFWAVYDNHCKQQSVKTQNIEKQTVGQLVCVTVYRKGAREVVRRLEAAAPTTDETTTDEGLTTDGACRGCPPARNANYE